ncbi:hypothetical protein ADUPG1_000277, partial [Aduncisulcus paluster]
ITIPDLTKCSSTLKILNVMANPLLSSLTPIASAALTNLTTLNVSGCNISDPSPLYALSNNSWTISLDYNYICGDTDSTKSFIENKFTFANVNLDNQTCVCSDDEYGLNPLSDNLVCSETKPGSGSWYIVCASDSYMSYTYAGEFICTQPDSSTTNCSGGCEYGYECRYLGDEVISDVSYSTGECQQVIVDESLHACVAEMFVDSDGNADYEHRTNSTPSLFSVASLKTLISVEDENNNIDPYLYCNKTNNISKLSGLEHLIYVTQIVLTNLDISETVDLEPFLTLFNLKHLELAKFADDVDAFYLPDLTLTALETFRIPDTPILLPSDQYVLPSTVKELNIYDLSNSANSLENLFLSNNLDISSLLPLVEMGLYSIQIANFTGCSISDLSPLYDFPNILYMEFYDNNICIGNEASSNILDKFTLTSGVYIGTNQSCECSSDSTAIGYTDTPITDNVVCSETLPGSGSWHYVCSSHSIASYTSVDTFECLAPLNADGETYGCSGGCEYGYECRYDDELTQSTSSCYPVIVDENLHAYVADMFVYSDGQPDYSHRTEETEDDPSLFSVASLRTISTSTLSNDGISLSNSDRFALLDGIEHIRSLTSISLPYHNFVSADPLGSLHGLESLSLAHNMYGAPEDAGGNAIEGFSDLSFICSLHSLSTLTLSSVTSVSALPNTSECADTYAS